MVSKSKPPDNELVAFDSNVLTCFLDGNNGDYRLRPDDDLADQRIAAVRLFMYCRPCIVPTVRSEAKRIRNTLKLEEHFRFIDYQFEEFIPNGDQEASIERRVVELFPYHQEGERDRQILAEVEAHGGISVLVTWDGDFIADLAPYTAVRLDTPAGCWTFLDIPRGRPPAWSPAPGHRLASDTSWRWV